ncbi:hypothetical protein [Streptomyces sp. NPDC048361]|uniref:hypothetical protein n=1 Tax=Streptomyces sp. NPDC048361 TaxID=3154720 RepID=UPI003442888A
MSTNIGAMEKRSKLLTNPAAHSSLRRGGEKVMSPAQQGKPGPCPLSRLPSLTPITTADNTINIADNTLTIADTDRHR